MLHRFFDAIREMAASTEFETYYMGIQRRGLSGAPTADEARRDYQASVWAVDKLYTF